MIANDEMTVFEAVRIISARALQVSMGAPVLAKIPKGMTDSLEIAKKEFLAGKVPMTVKRTLPNGEIVIVDIDKAIKKYVGEHF